ncbi:hypothetical protein KC332_g15420 [Hortaea werneckii]|nr:hypothetical protein KC358_g15457 [Hortaea werneckii]KAI6804861.1 hypothetical protein KC350_g14857 [Hortaea werneckii]KAI6826818.1 hypothetical protein KC342_g10311 [Hortaea werneckii]KAI6942026.1 hypothetical protein KC341_g2528 [Hortaea werneckii]KAI6946896.1 hypothetical protein KC348_g2844 [Hortaea werneckii]
MLSETAKLLTGHEVPEEIDPAPKQAPKEISAPIKQSLLAVSLEQTFFAIIAVYLMDRLDSNGYLSLQELTSNKPSPLGQWVVTAFVILLNPVMMFMWKAYSHIQTIERKVVEAIDASETPLRQTEEASAAKSKAVKNAQVTSGQDKTTKETRKSK